MADEIKVEDSGAKRGLAQFVRNLADRSPLLKALASSMYVSIRKTFRDQGVPADSWAPLAPSTVAKDKSKASAGRKILILSGRLLNSIQAKPTSNGIEIGTNLVYARVQQEGSKDWMGGAQGPRNIGMMTKVWAHESTFLHEIHYTTRVTAGGHRVPVAMRAGTRTITNVNGKAQKVRSRFEGPRQQTTHKVSSHTRQQNIPARPYLVFRPEDPARLRQITLDFSTRSATNAGLQLGTANGGTL